VFRVTPREKCLAVPTGGDAAYAQSRSVRGAEEKNIHPLHLPGIESILSSSQSSRIPSIQSEALEMPVALALTRNKTRVLWEFLLLIRVTTHIQNNCTLLLSIRTLVCFTKPASINLRVIKR
jgi:hypothetical protein